MPALFDALRVAAEKLQPELVSLRRHLHAHPELSWQEVETSSSIRRKLEENGIQGFVRLAKTGFFVDIKGGKPGPTIAYRADMDALAIQDAKKAEYRSQVEGVAHMCGHDVHTTIATGVALLLHENRDKLKGTVRVFWQPAEETTPSGAPEMIKDGLLEGVDAVYGIHIDPTIDSGQIGIRYGADTASFNAFTITVKAPGTTHSARPHTGHDTIWIAHQIAQNLYQLATRLTDARSPLVLSIGMFHGGDALNIIPDVVTFGGTVRASGEVELTTIREHIEKLVKQFSELYGVKIDAEILHGAPAVINNGKLVDFVKHSLAETVGLAAIEDREQSMGAEDFGYYTEVVPSVFMRIGSRNSDETAHPLHSNLFDIDESVLGPAAAVQTYLLIEHLKQNPLQE